MAKVNNLVPSAQSAAAWTNPTSVETPITLNSAPQPARATRAPQLRLRPGRAQGQQGRSCQPYLSLWRRERHLRDLGQQREIRTPVSSGVGSCGGKSFFVDHPISISIDRVKYYYLYDGLGAWPSWLTRAECGQLLPLHTSGTRVATNWCTTAPVHRPPVRCRERFVPLPRQAYAPDIGRFMQDPIMTERTWAYVGNNPWMGWIEGGILDSIRISCTCSILCLCVNRQEQWQYHRENRVHR